MEDIQVEVKGLVMHITVPLTKDAPPSTSGKSRIAATTSGFQTIEGTKYKLSMNITEPI